MAMGGCKNADEKKRVSVYLVEKARR